MRVSTELWHYEEMFHRFYDGESSLQEDIEHVSSPEVAPEDKNILNILVKYFHAYISGASGNETVSLEESAKLFHDFHISPKGVAHWSYSFPLQMLHDLAATTALFQGILNEEIPDDLKVFHGLDIGTGSGVLLLAQRILAARSRIRRIHILGVEIIDEVANRTRDLLEVLHCGTRAVVQGDVREPYIYKGFQLPLTFVSNETIPNSTARLCDGHEPFLQSNKVLFSAIPHLLDQTTFFPQKVAALFTSVSGAKLASLEPAPRKNVHILEKANQFQSPDKDALLNSLFAGSFSDLKHFASAGLFPTHIILQDCFVPIAEVGNDVQYFQRGERQYFYPRWQ